MDPFQPRRGRRRKMDCQNDVLSTSILPPVFAGYS